MKFLINDDCPECGGLGFTNSLFLEKKMDCETCSQGNPLRGTKMTPIQQFQRHSEWVKGINITLELTLPDGGESSSCHISADTPLWDDYFHDDYQYIIVGTVTYATMFTAQNLVQVEQALNEWLDDLGIEGIGSRPVFFRSMPDDCDEDNSQLFEWNVYNKGELK